MDLQEAAYYIDEQMRQLRQANPTSSLDRMAVVTALNTYNKLKKQNNQCLDAMNQKILELQQRIEKLAEKEQIVV